MKPVTVRVELYRTHVVLAPTAFELRNGCISIVGINLNSTLEASGVFTHRPADYVVSAPDVSRRQAHQMVHDGLFYSELVHGPYQVLGPVLRRPVLAPSADVGMKIDYVQITPARPAFEYV